LIVAAAGGSEGPAGIGALEYHVEVGAGEARVSSEPAAEDRRELVSRVSRTADDVHGYLDEVCLVAFPLDVDRGPSFGNAGLSRAVGEEQYGLLVRVADLADDALAWFVLVPIEVLAEAPVGELSGQLLESLSLRRRYVECGAELAAVVAEEGLVASSLASGPGVDGGSSRGVF